MASYLNGRLEAERAHSPREASQVECKDCFESVADADEEYCEHCGDPLCLECQTVINDEPLCAQCFTALRKAVIESLQNDTDVGDIFREAA